MLQSARPDPESLRARLRCLPLFPLPGSVLIPGGHLPLHVFEPRYRAMVRDCLASDRLLAIGLLRGRDGSRQGPAFHAVSGLGLISAHGELADGRFVILLEGLMRTRIVRELHSDAPYRQVRAVPVPDDTPPSSAGLALSARVLQQLVIDLAHLLPRDSGRPLARACLSERSPGRLADVVADAVLVDARKRQRFLEETDPARRLDLMTLAVSAVLARIGEQAGARAPN